MTTEIDHMLVAGTPLVSIHEDGTPANNIVTLLVQCPECEVHYHIDKRYEDCEDFTMECSACHVHLKVMTIEGSHERSHSG